MSVIPVLVEVDIQPGLPVFSVIGLPDKGLEEARQRVRSAIRNSGFSFPLGRVTVSLSPSDVRKQGASFDLPIALGILMATRAVAPHPDDVWVMGELGLEGDVRPVGKLVSLLVQAVADQRRCVVPCQEDAGLVPEASQCQVRTLKEAVGEWKFNAYPPTQNTVSPAAYAIDRISGQLGAKRALEICLAGGHNLMLSGPPGSGKSMLAKASVELLPLPGRDSCLGMMSVRCIAGLSPAVHRLPFRDSHQTLSVARLLGGAKPGELALAHGGVLFLDEMPHMRRDTLEALRQPMQDKAVSVSRNGQVQAYPADCVVIGARNHCLCGQAAYEGAPCACTARDLANYRRSISEPLLDRFDVFCEVSRETAATADPEYAGHAIAGRIAAARERQLRRAGHLNCRMQSTKEAFLEEAASQLVYEAGEKLGLSMRGLASVVRVSRTIADLAGEAKTGVAHVQEALQYRRASSV